MNVGIVCSLVLQVLAGFSLIRSIEVHPSNIGLWVAVFAMGLFSGMFFASMRKRGTSREKN